MDRPESQVEGKSREGGQEMKGKQIICLMLALLSAAVSCQRRDFAERITDVNLVLKVNTQIANAGDVPLPETMRVDLYDIETGKLKYTDYVGPTGGYIHPSAGKYDLVVYNIGTESTQIRNENLFTEIEAFTSEVSSYLKGQLSKFLASVARSKQQSSTSKAPEEERVVYEPDHLFVGHALGVDIPVRYEGDEDIDVTVEIDVHSVVETWNVRVTNVEGLEWVRDVVAVISGQVESHFIGTDEKSGRSVSIFFEKEVDEANHAIVGKFNTFGKHPDETGILSFDINVTDTGGEEQHFHFDVDSQFMDNPDREIVIDEPITIEEPKTTGGGFVPTVDEWENVHTDINL